MKAGGERDSNRSDVAEGPAVRQAAEAAKGRELEREVACTVATGGVGLHLLEGGA